MHLRKVWLSLFKLFVLGFARSVFGQQESYISSASFVTAGGISYARLACQLDPCYTVRATGRNKTGDSISQDLQLQIVPGCFCAIPPCPAAENLITLPLGQLNPGTYTFSTQLDDPMWGPQPPFSAHFNVPDQNANALAASREANTIRLDVTGINGCLYAIERSSTLTNWTELTSRVGAPFSYKDPIPAQESARFYRLRIAPNVMTSPGPAAIP